MGSSSSSTEGFTATAARNAQALLLAAGQRLAALVQLVLDLGPQRSLDKAPPAVVISLLAEALIGFTPKAMLS